MIKSAAIGVALSFTAIVFIAGLWHELAPSLGLLGRLLSGR